MSILAALAKAYDRLPDMPPYGYSVEKISFVVSLNADGSVASITDLREDLGKKKRPRRLQVPQPPKKASSIKPNLLWEKSAYALGVTAGPDHRTAREHASFKERHLELLADTEDEGLKALRRFIETWTPEQFVSPFWPEDMKDEAIVFALESERRQDRYLHDGAAGRQLVERSLAEREGLNTATCLVTGSVGPVATLHPSIKSVWGAQSSGASIVAFNGKSFESYGHEQGDNGPISEATTFKYTTALNTFLAGRTNRLQVGDASTVFWADAADAETAALAEGVFGAAMQVDETVERDKVGALLARIRNGIVWEQAAHEIAPELEQGVRFHVLGLAPNAARISIRFWFEDDFGTLAKNYQRFVTDMAIEPPPRDGYPPLWRYLNETAVLGKRENVQPNLAGEWMRSILGGTPYPLTLLTAVLGRIRADGDVNALRAAMLRAVLVRNYRMAIGQQGDKSKEAPVALDPTNLNKGYLLGRLFAAYEQAQTAALGRSVNATIKDKFYGSASATPRKVFALLEKGSANHLSKVGKQRPGQRVNLEKTIGGILEQMEPGKDPFPTSLPAEDQALFGLGYYHQRNEFFRKPETPGTEGTTP